MHTDELGYKFKLIDEELSRQANQQLAEVGLTLSQIILLQVVDERGGSCAQRAIERKLAVSHPTVTGLVKRLIAKGYVESFVSDEDARMKIVRLTPEGTRVVQRGRGYQAESERELTRGLAPDELKLLGDLLDKVVDDLRE